MTGESLSFGGVADRYDRARPGYPREAVAWLVGSEPVRVLELGAGTGKLTETLVSLGHNVMASDPDDRMLAVLAERAAGAHLRTHGAEEVPLPDRIADVVVSAQAWHWFDHDRAVPEIARVLKPGGVLALVWNERDETVPWVAKLGRLMGSNDNQVDQVAALRDRAEFPEIEETTFRHWQHLDRDGLLDLAASRSYVATLGEAEREETLAKVSALYDDYGRGPEGMKLPYVTRCFRASVVHPVVEAPAETLPESAEPAFGAGLLTSAATETSETSDPLAADDPGAERPPVPRAAALWAGSTFPGDDATLLIDFR